MGKPLLVQWSIDDWLTDKAIAGATIGTKGFWHECLMHMWSGFLHGGSHVLRSQTFAQLARLAGCSVGQVRKFIAEIIERQIGDVTICHGRATLKCRRIARLEKERELARARQRKHRTSLPGDAEKRPGNAAETPVSQVHPFPVPFLSLVWPHGVTEAQQRHFGNAYAAAHNAGVPDAYLLDRLTGRGELSPWKAIDKAIVAWRTLPESTQAAWLSKPKGDGA